MCASHKRKETAQTCTNTHRIAIIKLLNIKNDRRDMISGETMGSCLTQKVEMTNQTMLK